MCAKLQWKQKRLIGQISLNRYHLWINLVFLDKQSFIYPDLERSPLFDDFHVVIKCIIICTVLSWIVILHLCGTYDCLQLAQYARHCFIDSSLVFWCETHWQDMNNIMKKKMIVNTFDATHFWSMEQNELFTKKLIIFIFSPVCTQLVHSWNWYQLYHKCVKIIVL